MKRLASLFCQSSLTKVKGIVTDSLQSVIHVTKNKSRSIFTRNKPRHIWGWAIALGFLATAGYYQFSSSDSLAASGYRMTASKVATVAARYYQPYVSALGVNTNHLKTAIQPKGDYMTSLVLDKKRGSMTQPQPMSLQDFTQSANNAVHAVGFKAVFNKPLTSVLGKTWHSHGALQDTQATIDTLEGTIRSVGLNPEKVMRQAARAQGQGGIDQLVALETANVFDKSENNQEKIQLTLEKKELLEKAIQSLPLIAPVEKFRFTSGFGKRRDPFHRRLRSHNGVDLAAPKGTPIFAPSHGKVVAVGRMGGYGRVVKIDHGFGIQTFYAHLSKAVVKKGDIVKPNQTIALMGSTGRSTGSHLHYEIRVNGKVWNPQTFIEAGNKLLATKKERVLSFTKVHNF